MAALHRFYYTVFIFQARLHQYSEGTLIWKKGSFLKKNDHKAVLLQNEYVLENYGIAKYLSEGLDGVYRVAIFGLNFILFINCSPPK